MKSAPALAALSLLAALASGARLLRHKARMGLAANRSHHARSRSMSALYPFYHSTDGIREELQDLVSRCPGLSVRTVEGRSQDGRTRAIDVVNIRAPDSSPVNRNFLLFGEHSRELISPESGLHFVKTLCGETDLSHRAREVLKDSEFQIVVNGNPESRKKVEQGSFCLRTNPEGVDLNRNWDEEWQPDSTLDPQYTNPGPMPFSEPETVAFKQLAEEFKPTTFLTVHSGTKGMYMPWAYDMQHLAQRNQKQMMQILKGLDRDHCQCPYGAAGKEVGYSCPGTCLDWIYDRLKTPYAFAFEIYTGKEYSGLLKLRWQEKMQSGGAFVQAHSHLAHEHFADLFEQNPSCFVQLDRVKRHRDAAAEAASMSDEDCFPQFNPDNLEEYSSTIENWSAAYLDMAAMVARELRTSAGANATADGADAAGTADA